MASDGSDVYDISLTSPAANTVTDNGSFAKDECPSGCPCCCHTPSRDVQLVPSFLRPWIGHLNVPHTLPAVFWPSFAPCDHIQCTRGRQQVQNIKYTAPMWAAHIEATIRFESLPVHFCIQTPRVVPSLKHLRDISFDDFKIKLSTHELTLCDVESDGYTVLHVSPQDSHRV